MLNIDTLKRLLVRDDATEAAPRVRNDGMVNLLTGLGTRSDATATARFTNRMPVSMSQAVAEQMYTTSGFARLVVDLMAMEMTREGWEFEGDTEGKINKYFAEIKVKSRINELLKWARLYGGAVAVVFLDDGLELDKPVNYNAIRTINKICIYDRWRVSFSQLDFYENGRMYGEPEFYTITPYGIGGMIRVHESRVLRIDGDALPPNVFQQNNYWGASVLDCCYDAIVRLESAYGYTSNILKDFVQTTISINNLADLLQMPDGEASVKKRIELLDFSRSIMNMIVLDAENETYDKKASSVSGVPDLIDRFERNLASVTSYPLTKLFGMSARGLNATGDNDVRNFYDTAKSEQAEILTEPLTKLGRMVIAAKDSKIRNINPDDLTINFNPLWQLDDMQQVALRKTQAETDNLYISNGALSPAEVAISRFGGNEYSLETAIDENLINEQKQGEVDEPTNAN
jgi:phage-related protein (TIGR01555 family)